MSIASRLCDYISDMQIDQRELAKVLDLSMQTITGYCTGKSSPSSEGLVRIADAIGVSVDWLAGRTCITRWSPEFQSLKGWLKAKAPEIAASDALERVIQVARLMQEKAPICRQSWFMAGLWGIPEQSYIRVMSGEELPINEITLGRLADMTGLPEKWLIHGDPAFLRQEAQLGDYENVVFRLAEAGITPTELHQNMGRLIQMIEQLRRLS